jgi:alpha-N-arabinofuranosidase
MGSWVKNSTVGTHFVLLAVLFSSILAAAQSQPVTANIDASKTGAPISKYIYGQFLEHIGGIVNTNIWAEMLDDRKFYFPITSNPPADAPLRIRGDAWRCATGCRLVTTSSSLWIPIDPMLATTLR